MKKREQVQAEHWYHFQIRRGTLLQDVIHNLDWSPAKGPQTGSSLGQVDFKRSGVITEDKVLRLHSSMENTEEGGKIPYIAPRCLVFLRQKFALMHTEP